MIQPVKFPVDFEEKVKAPPAVGGGGYPYQISAKDLMEDFTTAALQVDDTPVGGLQLVETREKGKRTVALAGSLTEGGALPSGSEGDYLYHNGTAWVPRAVTELTISVCVDGTPTPITFLTVSA